MAQPEISLIGITGGSCSGKTSLTSELKNVINPDCLATFSFDDYLLGMEKLTGQVITEVLFQ